MSIHGSPARYLQSMMITMIHEVVEILLTETRTILSPAIAAKQGFGYATDAMDEIITSMRNAIGALGMSFNPGVQNE